MDFGFGVPTRGPMANPEDLTTLARRGEEMGFDFISASDHIVIPNSVASAYPYTETGEFSGTTECLEQLSMLSFLASCTSKARLLTHVLVLPHRNPMVAAKVLSTIDVLSEGRLDVGCGVGWMREEFEAIGTPPYEDRGVVGDEYIEAFKELWTSDNPSYHGRFCSFSDVAFEPKPVQKPHPPIWVGGESPPALRRAGRLGNGWHPIGENPRYPVRTPAELSTYLSRVHGHARDAGRDPSEIAVAYSALWYTEEAQTLDNGERRAFTGSAEQIAEDVQAFEAVGVGRLMINFFAGMDSLQGTLDRTESFMGKVIRPLSKA